MSNRCSLLSWAPESQGKPLSIGGKGNSEIGVLRSGAAEDGGDGSTEVACAVLLFFSNDEGGEQVLSLGDLGPYHHRSDAPFAVVVDDGPAGPAFGCESGHQRLQSGVGIDQFASALRRAW